MREAILDEVGPTRCRVSPGPKQSADEIHTPASQCLSAMSAMSLPWLQSRSGAKSTDCPLLNLQPWVGRRRGGPSAQVTEWQGRVLGERMAAHVRPLKRHRRSLKHLPLTFIKSCGYPPTPPLSQPWCCPFYYSDRGFISALSIHSSFLILWPMRGPSAMNSTYIRMSPAVLCVQMSKPAWNSFERRQQDTTRPSSPRNS
jgi:hypothetical protein